MKKLVFLILVILLFGCAGKQLIKVKGSDSMANLGQAMSEEMAKNSKVGMVITGGGSETGIAALLNGTADIAQVSKNLTVKEVEALEKSGGKLVKIPIAMGSIAVIVNKENTIQNIDLESLKAIYTGEIKSWAELGGKDEKIIRVSRDFTSGTYGMYKEFLFGEKFEDKNFSSDTLYLNSNSFVLDEVKKNEKAIGFISLAYISDDIKVLAVENKLPSYENIVDSKYPLARKLYWYTFESKMNNDIKKAVEFVESSKGQEIIEKSGFISLNKK